MRRVSQVLYEEYLSSQEERATLGPINASLLGKFFLTKIKLETDGFMNEEERARQREAYFISRSELLLLFYMLLLFHTLLSIYSLNFVISIR